jgi:uncharacterized membrane protein required for colicin V production
MYWLDIAILAFLGFGAGLGFWSGLLWQIARLASLGLSLYATFLANESVTTFLHERVAPDFDTRLLQAAAYVGVFLGVYVLLFGLTRFLHNAIRASKLEFIDRCMGSVLGAAKIAILLVPVCAGLAYLSMPITQEWMSQSLLAPVFSRGFEGAIALIPGEYREHAQESVQHLRTYVQRQATDRTLDLFRDE